MDAVGQDAIPHAAAGLQIPLDAADRQVLEVPVQLGYVFLVRRRHHAGCSF